MDTKTSKIIKPHHVNYVVSDLDQTIPFYRDVLGFKLIQDSLRENLPSYDTLMGVQGVRLRVALFDLPGTDILLELFQFFHPQPIVQRVSFHGIGSSHIALEIRDLDALFAKIVSHGGKTLSAPTDIYREGQLIARAMYTLDPDGIVLEMFEPNAVGRERIPGFQNKAE